MCSTLSLPFHEIRKYLSAGLNFTKRVARGDVLKRHECAARPFSSVVITLLMALYTLLFLAGGAVAQVQELLTPIPSNQLRDATPTQTQAIEKVRQRPTTQSLDLVRIDLNALRGDRMRVSIPNTSELTLSKRSEEVRSPTDFTYYGTLSGAPGQATLVVHNGDITGSIQDRGTLYRIEPVGNGVHALIKVDQGRFPPEHPPSFQQLERRGDIRLPGTIRDTAMDVLPVGIDVLVAYTTGARNAVANINATIQLAIAEANQSYINSGINIRLNLVDSFEVAYSETGKTFEQILADFVANPTVQNRRNSSGADLGAMIINQSDFCGLADAIWANASTAFAVVHYDCATGYYSFAHELGHLMAARHDENHDPSTTPFPYGHGYEHPSSTATQVFRTIMAYACDAPTVCNPRIQYWSNPNVQYAGVATGTAATNDNARVLNQTASGVAGFRNRSGWKHNDLTNATGAPGAVGNPAGYTWDVDKTQHVVYRGVDSHIHELWFSSSWNHNDLTNASGATVAASDPAGYTWDVDKTQHVVYRGVDAHIHELWFNSSSWSWNHNDLTNATGAPGAAGNPAGYTWDVDKTQHVVYRGVDAHIHELWFNSNSWSWNHNDLTNATGAPGAVGDPAGYTWDVDKTQHVVSRGANAHIHELWFSSSSWSWNHNDLTNTTGAPGAVGNPAGYTWDVDKTQHVVYRGPNAHINELWFNSSSWSWNHNDLTNATGAPGAAGDPAGYTWDVDKTQHVVSRGPDAHIHELWFSSSSWSWNHNDLTNATGAPVAASDPAGYTWDVDKTQHVVSRGPDAHIHELWFSFLN